MANNDEKILKALENLQAGQTRLEKTVGTVEKTVTALQADVKDLKQGQRRLEQGQAHTNTAVEALAAGQQDIREKMATKQDVEAEVGEAVFDRHNGYHFPHF